MQEVQWISNSNESTFIIDEAGERIAEMEVGIRGNEMSIYHTEVKSELEGQGIARRLLDAASEHARNNKLMVVPLCPYVLAQFEKHPEEYSDIWKK
jgi:predicted GNAT family acetyltransferase